MISRHLYPKKLFIQHLRFSSLALKLAQILELKVKAFCHLGSLEVILYQLLKRTQLKSIKFFFYT